MQRLFVATAVLLAALSTQAASPNAAIYQVGIRNFHFRPMQLVVPAGATVTWINHDDEPHVVTSAGGQFKSSPALDTDDHYSALFTKQGTYVYYCSIHPQMTGTIVVE